MDMNADQEHGVSPTALRNAEIMGEIRSDVKHILASLPGINKKIDDGLGALDSRLTVVEKFNTKVVTLATIGVPILTIAVNWLLANWQVILR